jgi:hypothetical protein
LSTLLPPTQLLLTKYQIRSVRTEEITDSAEIGLSVTTHAQLTVSDFIELLD